MMWIRRLVYRRGHRPRSGSLFYSPTLAWEYAWKDSEALKAFWGAHWSGYEQGRKTQAP